MSREIIIMIVFLAGLIFCITGKMTTRKEGFLGNSNCPNLLLQKGSEIFLYNKNRAHVPGVNPIKFNNLEEYVEFTEWQRRMGIKCPVLYLQQTYDAQNNLGWRPLNDPVYPNAGVLAGPMPQMPQETLLYDAGRLDPPYNQADYPAYDEMNQYIGDYTPLDKMFNQQSSAYSSQNTNDQNYYTSATTPGKYKSPLQYTADRPQIPATPSTNMSSTIPPTNQNGAIPQNGTIATPQTSSMAQYVGARTNPPDTAIENPPQSMQQAPNTMYGATQQAPSMQQAPNTMYGAPQQAPSMQQAPNTRYGAPQQASSMQQAPNTMYGAPQQAPNMQQAPNTMYGATQQAPSMQQAPNTMYGATQQAPSMQQAPNTMYGAPQQAPSMQQGESMSQYTAQQAQNL